MIVKTVHPGDPDAKPTSLLTANLIREFEKRQFMDGMLQGMTLEEAYFVRCDRTTMTQADIDAGKLILLIGMAPVKPAEFVIFRICQWTDGSELSE